jgi:crotonobetainyl-CoA:carnitine CoA-transferase CaiB-like acyl-CoA transferase
MQPSVDVFGGVRVVELAQWVFVPVAGTLLADWGAEVVKVEHPQGGDGYRGLVIPGTDYSSINYAMEMVNRNKRSVAIDLKTDEGRTILLKLVESADVFLTNFLPSVLDRLGLGVDALREVNPRLIYARGHGYGVRGDDSDTPAYDSTSFWARGAIEETIAPRGLPEPIPQRGAVGDRYGGTHLAFGIAGALFRRERTGEGSVVDVSLLSTALWMIGSDVLSSLQGVYRQSPPLGQPRTSLFNPLAANYRCADGRWLMICCLQPDKYWVDVCTLLGREDMLTDERFVDMKSRGQNSAALVAELEAAFAARSLDEWRKPLDDKRIPWGPYQRVDELLRDPAVVANGYIGTVERADGVSFPLPAGAVQFDEQPAALHACPELGEHTDEVLASLGYSWDDIVALKVSGAVL